MCSCRVQAHPRATRYIDNTHGRARRRTAGEEKEDERERERDERGKRIHAEIERGKWKRVGGYRWRVAKRAARRGEEGGEDSLPCPSSTNDRHPPLLPFTVLPTNAPLHSLPTTDPPLPFSLLRLPTTHRFTMTRGLRHSA